MNAAREAVRVVRFLHWIFFITIPMYAGAGELVGHRSAEPEKIFHGVLIAVALMNVGIAQIFGRRMVTAAEETLALNASDEAALARWRGGHLLTYVLCESVALFGLALRMLGGTALEAAPFYVLAIVLLLLWRPQAEFAKEM